MLGFVASITMPGLDDPNAVLSIIAVEHLQPIFVVLFVGAILSSIMSTSDSILLSSAAIISTNLLPLVKKDPDEKMRLAVDFRSPMAQSQKASEAGAVLNAVQSLTPFITVNPGILQNIDDDEVARFLWDSANANPKLLRDREQVAAIRQQEAQQQDLQ